MNNTHIPFLSRCALIVFVAGLVLSPCIYAFSTRADAEGASLFVALICLLLAVGLAVVARSEPPARAVLVGVPVVFCLLVAAAAFANWRSAKLRTEFQSRVEKEQAEFQARFQARRSQHSSPSNQP